MLHPNKIKNRLIPLVGVTFLLFLTSCATTNVISNLQQEYSTPLFLEYHVLETEIVDLRENISDGELKIPSLFWNPNQSIKHTPIFTDNHHWAIANTISENVTGNGEKLKIKVTILESFKEFASTWKSLRDKGFARIQIDFLDPRSGRIISSSVASREICVGAIITTPQRGEEVYQLSFKAVTRMCLESIQKMLKDSSSTN
ncbi:hypothetical protein [Algoriphagus sanaruensis]|uniref:ABC-type transport auxiliary lipoprotein component domain-containing protein n=1 Tax=Algoriphagus sanaruensis TaxID=1727163 RepID=A0A142EMC9_9BACT|nr:hypothetical protein [Algoriphagus sanaruensis]AMQ56284.1 hypothetical protein AO498_07640 [Algoriphagus sanaruensis]